MPASYLSTDATEPFYHFLLNHVLCSMISISSSLFSPLSLPHSGWSTTGVFPFNVTCSRLRGVLSCDKQIMDCSDVLRHKIEIQCCNLGDVSEAFDKEIFVRTLKSFWFLLFLDLILFSVLLFSVK